MCYPQTCELISTFYRHWCFRDLKNCLSRHGWSTSTVLYLARYPSPIRTLTRYYSHPPSLLLPILIHWRSTWASGKFVRQWHGRNRQGVHLNKCATIAEGMETKGTGTPFLYLMTYLILYHCASWCHNNAATGRRAPPWCQICITMVDGKDSMALRLKRLNVALKKSQFEMKTLLLIH